MQNNEKIMTWENSTGKNDILGENELVCCQLLEIKCGTACGRGEI